MKISSGLLILLENASGQTVGPGRTHDGTAYGDMVFSGCQYERMKNDPRLPAGVHFNYDGSSCSSPLARHFPTWNGYQDDSDGKFIVPFFFDSAYKNAEYDGYTGVQSASTIRSRLSEINDLLNVKFVEIFQDEVDLYPDHIEIVSEENEDFLSACASYIGKIGGKQKWFMRPDCAFHDFSQVNHFAMYILGFGPTFTRNSRHGQGNGYHESLMGNANYHFLFEEFHSYWNCDYRSVSNLLPYKLEDGSDSMFDDYLLGDVMTEVVRDFPLSYLDVRKINTFYPLDAENPCLNGAHKCPWEADCRPIPTIKPWYINFICDCPWNTVTSQDEWDKDADQYCMNVGDVDLFEWTAISNFPGYELRVAPSLELISVGDTTIRKYDSKQDVYARANLVGFDDADGNPVDPEFWPEMKNNVETFRDGYAQFEYMVMELGGKLEMRHKKELGEIKDMA